MPRGRKPKKLEPIQTQHEPGANIVQLDYKSEKITVSSFMGYFKKNKVKDIDFQRGICWNIQQRSLFIHSVIMKYYVPPLLMVKVSNKEFYLLDGKQRSSALYDFINNKYSLKNIPPITYDDGISDDLNGCKFDQLPDDVKTAINDYNLYVVTFSPDTTEEQAQDVFYRSNNGTALRSSDKNFSKAVNKDKITPLVSHQMFERAMTEKAREKLTPRQVIINSYILLLTEDYSLDTKDVTRFLSEYQVTDDDMRVLDDLFTRLSNISKTIEENSSPKTLERKAAKRILGRVNVPVLVKFLQTHEDDDKNAQFLMRFFSGDKKASVNEVYNEASQSGSGHLENVQKRSAALTEDYDRFEFT